MLWFTVLVLWVHAGSLFALEVLHRTGVQFYEMATFAVLAGRCHLGIYTLRRSFPISDTLRKHHLPWLVRSHVFGMLAHCRAGVPADFPRPGRHSVRPHLGLGAVHLGR